MPQRTHAIDEILQAGLEAHRASRRFLTAAVRRQFSPAIIRKRTPEDLADESQELLAHVDAQHISHGVLRRIERAKLSVRRGISFRAQMLEMSESRHLGVHRPMWKLDDKYKAYAFADAVGVRRPRAEPHTSRLDQLSVQPPCVVKATRDTGGRRCYLVFSDTAIRHVSDNTTLSSIDEMYSHAVGLMQDGGSAATSRDDWIVEELILEDHDRDLPARDLKFYTFYGQVHYAVEVWRGEGGPLHCHWDRDGRRMQSQSIRDLPLFEGQGVTAEQVEAVEEISRQIPYPFMRIDMLKGESELVLGEFTPRTGNFHAFTDEFDRELGESWIKAESRLYADLLQGKRFDAFLEATGLLESSSTTGGSTPV